MFDLLEGYYRYSDSVFGDKDNVGYSFGTDIFYSPITNDFVSPFFGGGLGFYLLDESNPINCNLFTGVELGKNKYFDIILELGLKLLINTNNQEEWEKAPLLYTTIKFMFNKNY